MGEIFKFIFNGLSKKPLFIAKKIFDMLRLLNTLFISIWIYKHYYGNFTIVVNIQELANFFLSGFFVKPVVIFIVVIIIFDVLLEFLIERLFAIILKIDKEEKMFDNIEDAIKTKLDEKNRALINRSMKIVLSKILKSCNKSLARKLFDFEKLKLDDYYSSINKINTEKFDIVCLTIGQLLIIVILYSNLKIYYAVILLITLFLIEYFKKLLIVAQRIFNLMKGRQEIKVV